jgi:hypothetical protein
MRTKIIVLPILFFLIMSIFASIALVTAQSTVSLTVTTNKSTTYDMYDPITLSGTLQYGAAFPSNALVAIEVDLPNSGGPMVLRTVQTGTGTVSGLPEQITSAYLASGLGGSQVTSVQNGELGYFTVSVTDYDSQAHNNMQLAITIFDGNGVPIGESVSTMSLGAGSTQAESVGIPIPTFTHSGSAYGYADLYSALPSSGGVPMAQELPFKFTISGGTPSSGPAPTTASATAGDYSLTFKLPQAQSGACPAGAYLVYASASYASQDVTAKAVFNVLLIGDFDFAGVVNGNDLFIFAAAYINYYTGQPWNHLCDINNEGGLDATDFFLFVCAYIQYWSP